MAKKQIDNPETPDDESLLDEPETEVAQDTAPDASESTETNAAADARFDAVVYIDSLNMPELRDFPKVLDDELGAYRRVPTSMGPQQARVGQWISSGSNGIHLHNTDPRT